MPATLDFPTARTAIAGQSVVELADQFGTPTYVYDWDRIDLRIGDLAAFDTVRYAQKAAGNIAILNRMRHRGVVVDAVSAGEIHRAIVAGFRTGAGVHDIVYTADIFDDAALDAVIEHDLHVNCGSPDMITQLGRRRPGSDITLRINPGFGHGHSQKTNTGGEGSKHGIWHTDVDDCLLRADQDNVTVTGLHMHIGSGTDLEHLREVCGAMERIALSVGRTVNRISAGGGLPVPYSENESFVDLGEYFELWDATRNRLAEHFGHAVELEIEPGRYLTAESGSLITKVHAVKNQGSKKYVLVDAGFNDLARPVMYGSHHPISVSAGDGSDAAVRSPVDVIVGGPLCESGDIFTQSEGGFVESRSLPSPRLGDYIVIENAGAYGFVMASNYNSKTRAAEVMIEGGRAKCIRRRESVMDLTRDEIIPN